ncbi:hypothetical protein SANTM175S_08372 [Streptomyces antimycoticus]
MNTSDAPTHVSWWASHRRRRPAVLAAVLAACALGALGNAPTGHTRTTQPEAAACPAKLAGKANCYTGQDTNGAYYTIAVPTHWNGSLVVHAHGGPDLGDSSDPSRSVDDLERWAVMVDQGYAWAGSSYRRGGYGTRMAAADTENVRRLFLARFGKPKRTYIHGQSWGGNVAAKVAETYGTQPGAYDGALLTSGVLGGGSRGYDYRVDLRVVYQYYCHNHPRPTEPRIPAVAGAAPGLHPDEHRAPRPSAGVHRLRVRPRGPDRGAAAQPRRHPRRHPRPGALTRIASSVLDLHLPGHRVEPARRP